MPMFIASANHNPIVTARDIAEKLGLSVHTVRGAINMNGCAKYLSEKTIMLVQAAAKEMGYDPKLARTVRRPVEKKEAFYYGGNFHTKEEEHSRMLALREEGYSNAEIAQKIGRNYQTVLRNLGTQPDDMTKKNSIEGQRIRRAKESGRKAYVQSHKVVEHNELVRQVNEVGDKIRASMAEMNTLRQTHEELVSKVAAKEADIRKVAEKMGMTVMEVTPVEVHVTETKSATQLNFLN